jgi:sigma-E factor negative regulatory protein RseC
MIEEQAVVLRVEHDKAYLEIVRRSACGLCGQTRGCGISVWGRLFGHRQSVFMANNQINAQTGDHVVVGVEEKALLASSLTAYGVPLLTLLSGTVIGVSMAPSLAVRDMYSVAGAAVGLLLGLFWLKGHAAGQTMGARYTPVILRRAEHNLCSQKCL